MSAVPQAGVGAVAGRNWFLDFVLLAAFYGVLFLGETVTGWMLLCGLVIVCGTALSTGLLKLRGLERTP